METSILPYFLKVNLALAILYICYRLLFRNDTFFRLRRAVLLSVYLIAFLYPLLDISIWLSTRESVTEIVNYYSTILPLKTVVAVDDTPLSTEADWLTIAESYMLLIYLAGITLLFLRCIIELFTVIRLRLRSPKQLINGTIIYVLPSQEEPYSFFGWIFASPESHTAGFGRNTGSRKDTCPPASFDRRSTRRDRMYPVLDQSVCLVIKKRDQQQS